MTGGEMKDDGGEMTDYRGEMTDERGEMTDDRGEMMDDRGEMMDDRVEVTARRKLHSLHLNPDQRSGRLNLNLFSYLRPFVKLQ